MTIFSGQKIALVLGGGGLKGFAHIGVLRALEDLGVRPTVFAGTSIGGLIAAAYAGGMSCDEMQKRAEGLRKRDLFRINHLGMLLERMHSPSIYLEEPLRELANSTCPSKKFNEIETRLLINTVDLARGTQVVWGLPGLQDVCINDAVYASCALPGFFPPGAIGGRTCVDGGTMDNLPAHIASVGMDAVISVDVGSSDLTHENDIATTGFANIYMRAATCMMHALQGFPLSDWTGPPMVLIRPKIGHIGWFAFGHAAELVDHGYKSAMASLAHLDACLVAPGGVFPRRIVRISVDRQTCTGCGTCVALAPSLMGLDSEGKAFARTHLVDWSPADGGFVSQCPVNAIKTEKVRPTGEPMPPQPEEETAPAAPAAVNAA